MDDFVDELFSSSPWADVSTTETSSWVGNGHAQNDGILADSIRTYEENQKNLAMNLSSLPVNGDSVYDIEKNLHIEEAQSQEQVLLDQDRQQLLVNDNLEAGYMGMQSNMYQSTLGTMNYSSPELISIVDGSSQSPCAPPESGSVGSNDTETSGVHPIMGESHSISSIPQIWSNPSYVGVSSISPVLGQDKLQGLGIEGEYVNTDANVFGNGYVTDDLNLQTGNLNASMPVQGEQYNYGLNSFPANHQIPMARTATMQSQLQLPQLSDVYPTSLYPDQNPMSQLPNSSVGAGDGSNGAVKPRVRARRGQATDPHSIAERLRREKISERMKNLQELVPSSTKSDKASVLDEIIEYVKFLQHQVKVLSMSRLGAAGAVVPLITEGHAELGSGGVLLPQSTVKANDRYDSPDDIAFEEEVVKLMESNVTEAMQYLQTKGLCLMPVALASAISSLKASSSPDSSDQKKPDLGQNNGPPAISNSQISTKEKPLKTENTVSLKVKEDMTSRGCNVTVTNLRETEKKKE